MRTWTRVTTENAKCGRCGNAIAVGAPALVIAIAAVETRLVRCETCAGESVPSDLPALEPPPAIGTPEPIRTIASRVVDYKRRQVGDDE